MPKTLSRSAFLILMLAAMSLGGVIAPAKAEKADTQAPALSKANELVLKLANALPLGGGYKWDGDTGVPFTIKHDGKVVLRKARSGTYCCGVTYAVAFKAAHRLGLLRDKSFDQVKQLQQDFYGIPADAQETLCVIGLERLNIGHAVEHDDAQAGDFAQFWRVKSGHSVVFLGWVTDDEGQRVGLDYWSSQSSTDGIGQKREYFAGFSDPDGKEGHINPERLYLGRLFEEPATEEQADTTE